MPVSNRVRTSATLYLRGLPQALVREAKAVAARRGITLAALVVEALRQTLPAEAPRPEPDDLAKSMRWFQANKRRLLGGYRGQGPVSQDPPHPPPRPPPAPVLPVRLGAPGVEPTVFLVALVDTGADLSVVPEQGPAQAHPPRGGETRIRGAGGSQRRVPLFAAAVEAAGTTRIV